MVGKFGNDLNLAVWWIGQSTANIIFLGCIKHKVRRQTKQKMTLSDTTKGSSTKLYLCLIYQLAKLSYSWDHMIVFFSL